MQRGFPFLFLWNLLLGQPDKPRTGTENTGSSPSGPGSVLPGPDPPPFPHSAPGRSCSDMARPQLTWACTLSGLFPPPLTRHPARLPEPAPAVVLTHNTTAMTTMRCLNRSLGPPGRPAPALEEACALRPRAGSVRCRGPRRLMVGTVMRNLRGRPWNLESWPLMARRRSSSVYLRSRALYSSRKIRRRWPRLVLLRILLNQCRENKNLRLPLDRELNAACVRAHSLSRVRLFAAPWTAAHQASLSMGFPRQEYWRRLPFPPPGRLPDSGMELSSPASLALAGEFFTTEPPGKSGARRAGIKGSS